MFMLYALTLIDKLLNNFTFSFIFLLQSRAAAQAKEDEATRLLAEANDRARQLEDQLREKEEEAKEKARQEHGVTPDSSASLGG